MEAQPLAIPHNIMFLHRQLMDHMNSRMQLWIRQQATDIREHGFGALQKARLRHDIIGRIPRPAQSKSTHVAASVLTAMVLTQVAINNAKGRPQRRGAPASGGGSPTGSGIFEQTFWAFAREPGVVVFGTSPIGAGVARAAAGLVGGVLATGAGIAGAGAGILGGDLGIGTSILGGVAVVASTIGSDIAAGVSDVISDVGSFFSSL